MSSQKITTRKELRKCNLPVCRTRRTSSLTDNGRDSDTLVCFWISIVKSHTITFYRKQSEISVHWIICVCSPQTANVPSIQTLAVCFLATETQRRICGGVFVCVCVQLSLGLNSELTRNYFTPVYLLFLPHVFAFMKRILKAPEYAWIFRWRWNVLNSCGPVFASLRTILGKFASNCIFTLTLYVLRYCPN